MRSRSSINLHNYLENLLNERGGDPINLIVAPSVGAASSAPAPSTPPRCSASLLLRVGGMLSVMVTFGTAIMVTSMFVMTG